MDPVEWAMRKYGVDRATAAMLMGVDKVMTRDTDVIEGSGNVVMGDEPAPAQGPAPNQTAEGLKKMSTHARIMSMFGATGGIRAIVQRMRARGEQDARAAAELDRKAAEPLLVNVSYPNGR